MKRRESDIKNVYNNSDMEIKIVVTIEGFDYKITEYQRYEKNLYKWNDR